jgi:flavin reductase (DIM6/NTAB) family NADH-FMN oxidoreductase RutF
LPVGFSLAGLRVLVDILSVDGGAKAGLMVASPRILAAPTALECCRHTTLQVGPAREIILGEVVGVFVRSDAVNASNLHIDQQLMDAVGRMGGHSYARTRDQFDIKALSPAEWESRKSGHAKAAE